MTHKTTCLGLLAVTLIGCSGGSFGSGISGGTGESGAAGGVGAPRASGGASGSQDSSSVGGRSGSAAGGSDAAGGLSGVGGSEPVGGAPPAGGAGGSGPATGGMAGQDPAGGSGGSEQPSCTRQEAVTVLPLSVTVDEWSYTRTGTGHCATCTSQPCLHCSLAWLSPTWDEEGVVQFTAGRDSVCSGSALAGECGAEEECVLDVEHTDSYIGNIYISVVPCGNGWCAEEVDVWRFVPVFATCLSTYGADSSLNEAAEQQMVADIEATFWPCP